MAELIWGGVAISDLECIYDYIARDSHHYARHQIERIFHSVERLRQFPSGQKFNVKREGYSDAAKTF